MFDFTMVSPRWKRRFPDLASVIEGRRSCSVNALSRLFIFWTTSENLGPVAGSRPRALYRCRFPGAARAGRHYQSGLPASYAHVSRQKNCAKRAEWGGEFNVSVQANSYVSDDTLDRLTAPSDSTV
jgi:hypothetical protein